MASSISRLLNAVPVDHTKYYFSEKSMNTDSAKKALEWFKRPPYMYTSLCPDPKYRPENRNK